MGSDDGPLLGSGEGLGEGRLEGGEVNRGIGCGVGM